MTFPACEVVAAYVDLTREDWLALRKTGLGGSDAAACMGMTPYSSKLILVLDKTGRFTRDVEGEQIDVGNILEPIIRHEMVGQYIREKLKVEAFVFDPEYMYRSREWPWMLCNPDGFLSIDGRIVGLEIKTGSSYQLRHWGGHEGGSVPDPYYCQVQHYMAVTGLDEWWTFGLIGNQRELRIVPRNDEFIRRMVAEERYIWEIVEANDPLMFPAPNGSDADAEAVFALGSPQQDTTMDLSALEQDITYYQDLGDEIKDKTAERKALGQKIRLTMDTSRYGETALYRVSAPRWMGRRVDLDRLRKDHPDLVEEYTDYVETGRLYIKER